jgi:hypothetical protein
LLERSASQVPKVLDYKGKGESEEARLFVLARLRPTSHLARRRSKVNNWRPQRIFYRLPSRHGLARELLVADCGLVNEGRHDGRGLLHVFSLNAIKHVLVRVVRARVVFNLILNKLKTRQPDTVKREVIGAAGV